MSPIFESTETFLHYDNMKLGDGSKRILAGASSSTWKLEKTEIVPERIEACSAREEECRLVNKRGVLEKKKSEGK